jgi:hypothetical protein
VNALAGEAGIDADHTVAMGQKKCENDMGGPCLLIGRANHRDGFHGRENIAQKGVGKTTLKQCGRDSKSWASVPASLFSSQLQLPQSSWLTTSP